VKYIKVSEEESHSINHESNEGLTELRMICAIARELGKLTGQPRGSSHFLRTDNIKLQH
jgi:hypothetical protein